MLVGIIKLVLKYHVIMIIQVISLFMYSNASTFNIISNG